MHSQPCWVILTCLPDLACFLHPGQASGFLRSDANTALNRPSGHCRLRLLVLLISKEGGLWSCCHGALACGKPARLAPPATRSAIYYSPSSLEDGGHLEWVVLFMSPAQRGSVGRCSSLTVHSRTRGPERAGALAVGLLQESQGVQCEGAISIVSWPISIVSRPGAGLLPDDCLPACVKSSGRQQPPAWPLLVLVSDTAQCCTRGDLFPWLV